MADWSVKIVPSYSGTGAAFIPDLQGYQQGDPLQAQQDDLVTWSNTTNDTHQPWPTDASYNLLPDSQVLPRGSANYLSDPIPAHESSRPSYDVVQPSGKPNTWTIYYCCKLHPTVKTERGTIQATEVPTR